MTMDDAQITTLEQIKQVLKSAQAIAFKGTRREPIYLWIEGVLKRFKYFELNRYGKGLVKTYLQHLSGFSRAQLSRLVLKCLLEGAIRPTRARRNRFPAKYTNADKQLLALTDNAHGRMSGPATKRIMEREYAIYGDKRFARVQGISVAHIYRLRKSRVYREHAQTIAKTKSVSVAIGIRRKPEPQGRPGYVRVDTVHQGDLDGKKGVYHVNLVDAETQWEVVACVESISEAYLMPVLEAALRAFPFVVLGFHSDNGSEYINLVIAKLLNKLLIEQRHAPAINRFYEEHFNAYLNFHRPCGFATVTVDAKGRGKKKYKTYQTPYERLRSLVEAARTGDSEPEKYLLEGLSLKILDGVAARQSDNAAAQAMQEAKDRLFKTLGTERGLMARAVP